MLFSRDAFHVHKSFRVNESSSDGSSNIFHESASIFDNAEQIANAIIEQQKRHQLSSNGGGGTLKSCLVGIVASKSAFLASMVIGVLRTGNAFAIFEPGPASFIERRFARFRIKLALFNATSLPLNEATQFCGTKFVDDGTAFGRLKIGLFDGAKTMQKSDDYDADDGGISMDFGQIAYAIQTSGSTGISKVVLVPFSAILPNIEDFIDRFSLGPLSTVLFATQTHFDPSMVELFVAMRAGAELVIPPPNWLFGKSAVAGGNLLRSDLRLSFVQLTPAVLQCLSMDILRHIFGPNSPIQTLLVGGDNFPLNLVKNYMSPACPMVVYNVYGLTEVSCWASVHRFDPSDTNKHPHNLVPIGQPLMGTRFQISTDGILLIHGRRCAINFEQYNNNDDDGWDERPTSTGDIAFEMTGDEDEGRGKERAIFVRGRYKPNSVLPNPVDIESEVMAAFSEIVFAKLLYVDNCRFLFVDHLDGISALSEREIRAKIAKWQWPTRTFWNIDRGSGTRRRLTENGKIDEHFLRQFVLSKYRGQISLQQFLDKRFGIVPNSEEVLHSSLRSLGIGAAELAFLLQHHSSIDVDDDDEEPTTDTLRFLLDERHTLGQLLCRFSTMISTNANNNGGGTDGGHHGEEPTTNDHDNNNNHDGIFHQQLLQISPKKFDIDEKWAQNLGKCIDGTPICHDGTVYAASHSGTVMGVQLATGVATISLHFPGDRFEAGCSVAGVGNGGGGTTLLAFGGFAGRMRLFTLASTQTKQCQRQEAFVTVDCGAEIRMAPVFDVYDWDHDEYNGNANDADGVKNGTMRLFWGSYNGHIWRLDIICRRHKGNKNGGGTVVVVGDHSMAKFDASRHGTLRTSPLLIRSSDNSSSLPIVIFGTLSATVFAVRCKEFDSVLWSLQMDSPIFAAPIAFVGGCLSLSVKGQILLIRPNDGHIISRATCLLSSNNDYRFFDSPTPIGHADAAAVVDKQHNHLLLISTGANALLLLSYSSHSYRSDLSPNYCNGNDSNSSFSVLRRFVMPCQSATAEYIVRRPVLFDQCRRRFAFLLTNKGTLFRLSLTEILSLSYHNDHSSTDDNVGGPSSSSADAVVVPPVLDCVFTMDHQQQHRGQVETFGHPLLSQYHHHHQTRTTREHEEEIVDDDVDLPFFVVFGARDDLLRARLCVPPQQRHKPN